MASRCWSENITFKEVSDFLDITSKEKRKKVKYGNLIRFLSSCRSKFRIPGDNLYPVMRLLLPDLDKARGSYMIRETVMANLYIEFLQLGPNSAEALKLKHYRTPKNNTGGESSGDFASILHGVLQARSYTSTGLSCAEVNSVLNQIVSAQNGGDGRRAVAKIFKQMFMKMDSTEQKWFVRLVLKDLMMGLGEKTLLSSLHPDAKDLYDVNANLAKVCEKLVDPHVRLNELEVSLMGPFKPQLADRVALNKIAGLFKDRHFYIETKYDGERAQVHMSGDQFRYFSRNGNDFSSDFGPTVSSAGDLFSPYLARSLSRAGVRSIILDGEMCAWSKRDKCIVQKGEQFNIRALDPEDPKFQQCLVLYDICLLNDKVLTGLPLKERLKILSTVVEVKEGRVEMVERRTASTGQEVVAALNEAIDRREEGLVVKDPNSVYKPGGRAGAGWIKVKPEYQNQLMDQLDLAIVGGYYGKRAGGQVTHFLLAVRDSPDRPEAKFRHGGDEGGDTFITLVKVSCGYSASELVDLVAKCKTVPARLNNIIIGKEKPAVWFDPAQCPVLQVKAAEIVFSDTHATKCTLRFPRVEKIREDKDSGSCTSRQELERLRQEGGGKLFGGVHLSDSQGEEKTASRKRQRTQDRPQLAARYRHQDLTGQRVDSHSLKGKVVVVEPANAELKLELERLVVKHGGTVEQNVRIGHTSFYIETGMAIKAKNLVNQGMIDVIKSTWLLSAGQNLGEFQPHHVIYATPETMRKWDGKYDNWMDSYTQPATLDSLIYSMDLVGDSGGEVTLDMRAELEEEAGLSGEKCFMFRHIVFYFPPTDGTGIAQLQAEFYGGRIENELVESVSHVLIIEDDEREEILDTLKRKRRERVEKGGRAFYIVSEGWLDACLVKERIVGEENFLL